MWYMKVVYEIFDSFQLLSLIYFRGIASPCGGVAVGATVSIRSTVYGRGHRPSHDAYIGRLVSRAAADTPVRTLILCA